jgi:hypothetical protein
MVERRQVRWSTGAANTTMNDSGGGQAAPGAAGSGGKKDCDKV